MEQADMTNRMINAGPEGDDRVWLIPRREILSTPGRICLHFPGGAISTGCGSPLSFDEEKHLMEALDRTHHLLALVFFDGMPYEQFCNIQEKINKIQRINAGAQRIMDEQRRKSQLEKCDALWREVEDEAAKAMQFGLAQTERRFEL